VKEGLESKVVMKNIYPWFFPVSRTDSFNLIDPHFHFNRNVVNSSRYPSEKGFMAITEALRTAIGPDAFEKVDDPEFVATFDQNGKFISPGHEKDGLHLVSIDYSVLSSKFSLPFPKSQQTYFYLVSIVLDRPIKMVCNEFLVADKTYLFDRISSPDVLQGKEVVRIQFEAEDLEEINEEMLLSNIKQFFEKHLGEASFKHVDVRKVKVRRPFDSELESKTRNIINFVESKNPNLLVTNRSMNFENLADGVKKLIELTRGKMK
jgi:hypothetical protein